MNDNKSEGTKKMSGLEEIAKSTQDYKESCELIHRAILIMNPYLPREIEIQGMVLEIKDEGSYDFRVNLRKVSK